MTCFVKDLSICILFAAGAFVFYWHWHYDNESCSVRHSVFYSLGL